MGREAGSVVLTCIRGSFMVYMGVYFIYSKD